jgi:hypothetical protein
MIKLLFNLLFQYKLNLKSKKSQLKKGMLVLPGQTTRKLIWISVINQKYQLRKE